MKTNLSLRNLAVAGLLAAAITMLTTLLHMPIGSSGGYIHFGDALIYLTAALLPTPYAVAAAAIGGGLADLLTAPAWVLPTIIVKSLIVLPFTAQQPRFLCKRNVLALFLAGVITIVGYYLAEGILFGGWAALITSVSGNSIQVAGSSIIFLVLGSTLDGMRFKSRLMPLSAQKS